MTQQQAIERLREILGQQDSPDNDPCQHHIDADEVLCDLLTSLGMKDVVDEYEKVGKWYA